MMKPALFLFALAPVLTGLAMPAELADANVVWSRPSDDSFDTMPLSGEKGAGANVWFQDGALWLYLAHAGAWDEASQFRKLGALRLTPGNPEFRDVASFRQELDLPTGSIRIDLTSRGGAKAAFRLWYAREALVIESETDRDMSLGIEYASWRARPDAGDKDAEHVLFAENSLGFFRINPDSKHAGKMAAEQGVPASALPAVAKGRVFGGVLTARGGLTAETPKPVSRQIWKGFAWPLRTVSAKSHLIVVATGAGKNASPEHWDFVAKNLLKPEALDTARRDAAAKWDEFWERSHVFIRTDAPADDAVAQVGRNYQRFRYMTACNRGGEMPLKFNGGIFTSDPRIERVPARLNNPGTLGFSKGPDPDFLRWGSHLYMGQNQRWLGWPTIACGDTDLLAVSRTFYRDRLEVARARAKNLGASGACYVEPLDPDGLCCVAPTAQGLCGAPHLTYHFSMALEHAWMTLLGHDTSGGDITPDLPWMVGQLRFFDSFYRKSAKKNTGAELGADGRLILSPTNGLELTAGAVNPVETVAALRRVAPALLTLKELSAEDRAFLEKFVPTLPEIPETTVDGRRVIAPAGSWKVLCNGWEFPELYAAWPYKLVGVTRPETLPLARATWEVQKPRGDNSHGRTLQWEDLSWQPTLVDTAALGMTREAAKRVVAKMSDAAGPTRFPAFFGPGHDWLPDHNWGGSGMVGLQEMLMSCDDQKIVLFPAWPAEWDVKFKLHAPARTVVEAELKGGKLALLRVTPESRRKDIVNRLGE